MALPMYNLAKIESGDTTIAAASGRKSKVFFKKRSVIDDGNYNTSLYKLHIESA